jgi:hypothetical protein
MLLSQRARRLAREGRFGSFRGGATRALPDSAGTFDRREAIAGETIELSGVLLTSGIPQDLYSSAAGSPSRACSGSGMMVARVIAASPIRGCGGS